MTTETKSNLRVYTQKDLEELDAELGAENEKTKILKEKYDQVKSDYISQLEVVVRLQSKLMQLSNKFAEEIIKQQQQHAKSEHDAEITTQKKMTRK